MYIGIQGFIGSGKDTAGRYIENKADFVKDSFARTLKDVCAVTFNWPRELLEGDTEYSRAWREQRDDWWSTKLGIHNFTPRFALQYVGTEVFRQHFHEDIWLLTFQNRLEQGKNKNVILSDCRFRNEINFFKNAGGQILFIDDGTRPEWYQCALDVNTETGNTREYALSTMNDQYSHIHRSEWDWIGTEPDAVILNDFEIKSPDTLEVFLSRIDESLEILKGS